MRNLVPIAVAFALASVAGYVLAAPTGITANQIKTAAPSGGSEGTSLALLRSDAVFAGASLALPVCAVDQWVTADGGNPFCAGYATPITIANGGTASATASDARTALGVAYGTTAGTVAQGNDSRLSDSRAPNGSAGGDLTGTYPSPTLATSGVSAATYGSASTSATVTFDAKGRATGASNTTIAIAASAITSGTLGVANGGTGLATTTTGAIITGGNATAAMVQLADVATGQVLTSGGTSTIPAWSASPSITALTCSGAMNSNSILVSSSGDTSIAENTTGATHEAFISIANSGGAGHNFALENFSPSYGTVAFRDRGFFSTGTNMTNGMSYLTQAVAPIQFLTHSSGLDGFRMIIDGTGHVGITNPSPVAWFDLLGTTPASVGSGNGTAATNNFILLGGAGGAVTTASGSVSGGIGSGSTWTAGAGGAASGASTTNTGGAGGDFLWTTGAGGAATLAGTNNGGRGGNVTFTMGAGGAGASAAGAAGIFRVSVGGFQLDSTSTRPTCVAAYRFTFWTVQGVTGGIATADTVAVCAKDAADAYAWRTIY